MPLINLCAIAGSDGLTFLQAWTAATAYQLTAADRGRARPGAAAGAAPHAAAASGAFRVWLITMLALLSFGARPAPWPG